MKNPFRTFWDWLVVNPPAPLGGPAPMFRPLRSFIELHKEVCDNLLIAAKKVNEWREWRNSLILAWNVHALNPTKDNLKVFLDKFDEHPALAEYVWADDKESKSSEV